MKNNRKKKVYILVFCPVLLLFFTLFLVNKNNQWGQINGKRINQAEILTYAEKNENQVATTFSKKYQITSYGKNFWKKKYNNKKPVDVLYEQATHEVVQLHLVFDIAQKLNISDGFDFSSLRKAWKTSSSTKQFWEYLDNSKSQLEDSIKDEYLKKYKPSNQELKKAFASLDDNYKKSEYIVKAIEFNFPQTQENVLKKLQKLARNAPQNQDFAKQKKYWQEQLPQSEISDFQLDSTTIQKEDLYTNYLGELFNQHNEREVMVGYQTGQYFYVVKKNGGELLTYEALPRLAESKYVSDLLAKNIEKSTQEAKVKFYQKGKKQFIKHYQ